MPLNSEFERRRASSAQGNLLSMGIIKPFMNSYDVFLFIFLKVKVEREPSPIINLYLYVSDNY